MDRVAALCGLSMSRMVRMPPCTMHSQFLPQSFSFHHRGGSPIVTNDASARAVDAAMVTGTVFGERSASERVKDTPYVESIARPRPCKSSSAGVHSRRLRKLVDLRSRFPPGSTSLGPGVCLCW